MSNTLIEGSTFREVMGHFPTGVVVVTSMNGGEPLGMTLQSFVSLSLEPPLVLLSVARTSRTWPRIAEAGHFVVNILAEGQGELARTFARSGADKFAGVRLAECPRASAPVLAEAVAWIGCEIRAEYDGGDHLIVVAQVNELEVHPSAPTGEAARALVFHRSGFGCVRDGA